SARAATSWVLVSGLALGVAMSVSSFAVVGGLLRCHSGSAALLHKLFGQHQALMAENRPKAGPAPGIFALWHPSDATARQLSTSRPIFLQCRMGLGARLTVAHGGRRTGRPAAAG